jgi:hypothetical protein
MKNLIKDLWPAVLLILGATAILLLSDLGNRHNEQGIHTESDPKGTPGKKLSHKTYKIRLVIYSETAFAERSRCREK